MVCWAVRECKNYIGARRQLARSSIDGPSLCVSEIDQFG